MKPRPTEWKYSSMRYLTSQCTTMITKRQLECSDNPQNYDWLNLSPLKGRLEALPGSVFRDMTKNVQGNIIQKLINSCKISLEPNNNKQQIIGPHARSKYAG